MVDDGLRPEHADEAIRRVREGGNPNELVYVPFGNQQTWRNPFTALALAVYFRRTSDIVWLLDHGSSPDGAADSNNPLMFALIYEEVALARLLLEYGARPDGLLLVCRWAGESSEQTRLLLEFGADPNAQGTEHIVTQTTPLLNAVMHGNAEVVRVLLEHGAKTETQDAHGFAALASAAYAPHNNEQTLNVARALLEHGADVNARTGKNQFTPLMLTLLNPAAGPFLLPFVELLLEYGADVNARGAQGQTPLLVACRSEYPEIVRLLLQHRADADAKDDAGRGATHLTKSQAVRAVLLEERGW